MWGIGARAETHLPPAPSFSVMHYRPLSFLGVSSGLDLLSRETYTHRRTHTYTRARTNTHTHAYAGCGQVDLSACRTRLDFQYGFVLQRSTLPFHPPVSVNVISPVLLLPECCLSSPPPSPSPPPPPLPTNTQPFLSLFFS